jgi:ABC-type metal ion transport system substrate-binding protein
MKKIIGFVSLAVVLTAIIYSCRPAAKKEVIVVPSNQPAKEPAKKSTTITLDKNGVKVEAKKVDVVIKKD